MSFFRLLTCLLLLTASHGQKHMRGTMTRDDLRTSHLPRKQSSTFSVVSAKEEIPHGDHPNNHRTTDTVKAQNNISNEKKGNVSVKISQKGSPDITDRETVPATHSDLRIIPHQTATQTKPQSNQNKSERKREEQEDFLSRHSTVAQK